MTQVVVPDIGDFKDVAVIEVLVKPGDAVSKEQSLITLESDKATMEIPSPSAGVVKELKIKMGDKVSKGSPILELDAKDDAPRQQAKAEQKPEPRKEAKPEPRQEARPPQARPTGGDGSSTTIPVPDIGDFKEVEVIEVLVKPGDAVTKEQSLITLESDKATMEIPSPSAGVVRELKIKVGDKVSRARPSLCSRQARKPRRARCPPPCRARRPPPRRHPRRRLPGRRQALRRGHRHLRRNRYHGSRARRRAPSRTRARRCASLPASSASTCLKCRAADPRAASCTATFRGSSRALFQEHQPR